MRTTRPTSHADLPPPPRRDAPPPRRSTRAELILIATILVALIGSTVMASAERDTERAPIRDDVEPQVLVGICAETDRLLDRAESMPVADGLAVGSLKALAPTELDGPFSYAGQRRIANAETIGDERGPVWLAELERDGFRRGLIRAWRLPDGAFAQVQVYDFATRDGALAFQRFALMDQSCPYSTDAFTVEGVNDAIGLQIRWADGTESEQVSFVRGTRRYLANVRGPAVPQRDLVVTLTERLNETAR